MTARQIIFEIDCLPKRERAAVVLHVLEIAKEMAARVAKPRAHCLADALQDGTVTPEELRSGHDSLHRWLEVHGIDFATLGKAPSE